MTENRTAWNDERLSDLRELVTKNNERIDAIQNLLAAHDLQLTEIERERRSRLDQRFSMRLAMVTVVCGQLATIAVIILTSAAHH